MPTGAFSHVILDCDSTLSRIEGIEELAAGRRAEVAAMTRAAMAGEVPLEAVYGRRLALVRPTRDAVAAVAQRYIAAAVADARDVVAALVALGKHVHVVSGGVRPAVAPFAAWLGVPHDQVHAVDLRFDPGGAYAGFDERAPLARRGGKRDVVRRIVPPDARAAMVGDGATDLEASDLVALFIGYGGVARHAEVERQSPVFIRCESLAPLLPLLLTEGERARLRGQAASAALLARGEHLLRTDVIIQGPP